MRHIDEQVTTANFPTRGADGSAFFGRSYLNLAEKERKKREKRLRKLARSESIDYMLKKKPAPYGKNPKGCDVLRPPDIDCTRANIVLPGGKKVKATKQKRTESLFVGRRGELKLLECSSEQGESNGQ